jgi:hypothetical protein
MDGMQTLDRARRAEQTMSFWSRLFGTPRAPGNAPRTLLLEGTAFALFTQEEPFLQSCATTGQGALGIPFLEFWPASRRGAERKIIGGGIRLLCAACFVDMPFSFQMSLPGGLGAGTSLLAIGEGLPSNLFGAAHRAVCPWCGSRAGIIVWDDAPPGEITEQDMAALRELWKQRCRLWWRQNDRAEGLCDRCGSQAILRGQGYHRGSEVVCEPCACKCTDAAALDELRRKPDYFGTSELRRARNLAEGRWQFEPAKVL